MAYAAQAVKKANWMLGTRELAAVGALSSAALLAFSGDVFFAGGLTALGIGLLLAPQESTRETRREEAFVYETKGRTNQTSFYP